MSLKRSIRSCFRHLGLELRRFHPAVSSDAALIAALKVHNVNLIFDVGANTGQFGEHIRDLGYRGRIVSFEPLSSAHMALAEMARGDPLWSVPDRMAIGSSTGEIEIHVAGNSVSSSVLPMLDAHSETAPASAYVGAEKVRVETLDHIAPQYLRPESVSFLKIDTQGYEQEVLRGASELLKRVIGLQLELSLLPLYEGQCLFDEMVSNLKERGFEMWGMAPAFADPRTGQLLQVDATFFRARESCAGSINDEQQEP